MEKKHLLQIMMVSGCSYCLENLEKEPLFCGIVCGISAAVGAKLTYDSAKLLHKNFKPFFSGCKNLLKDIIK